ncbi:hypothetical protein NVP1215B_070 [Vibrio phage 1.215.B._10N.222.54.F7]|nr:hypothetical protein NVP1215A_070 [Vibrio phage 1.215.A._10N.222.54.F7]AUR96093.1 hypothetical protein NVP1215B_070 [Vibrio phage 1.215.B._10N.222.54.F7]
MSDENRVVKIRARSLKNAEASFISIVDRGANRLPIRMLKNEGKNMFNLDNLFLNRGKKSEPKAPEIMGMLVTEENAQGYVNALKSESNEVFVLDTETEGVKFVSYKEEASLEGAIILRGATDESPAIVVESQKMLSDFGFDSSQGFAGSVASYGFYSNLDSAMRVLSSAMWDIMETATPGETPTAEAETLINEFSTYVLALMQTVPMEAFKMEKLQPVADLETAAKSEEGTGESTTTEGSEAEGGEAEGGEAEGAEAVGGEGAEATGETATTEEGTGEAAKGEESDLSKILGQISSFGETLTAMGQSMESLKSEVNQVSSTVAEQGEQLVSVREGTQKAEELAQAAKDSASSVVIDTDNGRTSTQKSDDEDYDPNQVNRRNTNIEYT